MSDKKKGGISRRKALLTAAGLGSTLFGVPGTAAADTNTGSSNRGRTSGRNFDENYWRNEDGEVVFDNAEFEKWAVVVADNADKLGEEIHSSQITDEAQIYVGKYKNSSPSHTGGVRTPRRSSTREPDTRVTLGGGTLPDDVPQIGGAGWALTAGLQFDVSAVSAGIDVSLNVGAGEVVLCGWSVGYNEKTGLCTKVSPSQFPISVQPCINAKLRGRKLVVGGSVNLCAPPNDPCPAINCQYCLTGLGLAASVDTPW